MRLCSLQCLGRRISRINTRRFALLCCASGRPGGRHTSRPLRARRRGRSSRCQCGRCIRSPLEPSPMKPPSLRVLRAEAQRSERVGSPRWTECRPGRLRAAQNGTSAHPGRSILRSGAPKSSLRRHSTQARHPATTLLFTSPPNDQNCVAAMLPAAVLWARLALWTIAGGALRGAGALFGSSPSQVARLWRGSIIDHDKYRSTLFDCFKE